MANVLHSALTGSDLHEPKGVAAAAAGKVYESDGAASGAWTKYVPRGYIDGFIMSNNATDGDHDIDITAGVARNAANTVTIETTGTIVKRIDASWVTGTGNGGLSSSLTLSADTWYHVFAIIVSGTADFGFDTSVTGANLVTDHSATSVRRIGSVLTNSSSNIIAFDQFGDEFQWKDPPLSIDVSGTGTSAATDDLTVPTGIRVQAKVNLRSTSELIYLSSLAVNDEAPAASAAPLASDMANTDEQHGSQMYVVTNTSAQIRYRASGNHAIRIATLGWIDPRGRTV